MSLSLQNIPSVKEEGWQYTNLAKVLPGGLACVPKEQEQDIIIHRNKGQLGGDPVTLKFSGCCGYFYSPRLQVNVLEGADLVLIERHDGAGNYWRNLEVEITLGVGAKLRHYRVLEDGVEGVCTIKTHVTQAENSSYESFSLLCGSKLTRNEFYVGLQGDAAHSSVNALTLLGEKQLGDTTVFVDHQAPHCTSDQFVRTLLTDRAHGVFQGKTKVGQIAQKTEATQMSNAILLSDKCEMNAKPELEIYADDVECAHGNAIGTLDEMALFYMQQRGLPEADARRLLVESFLDEALAEISHERTAETIRGLITKRLKDLV